LNRQNFFRDEIGEYKSIALATRLSKKYDRPIAYSTLRIEDLEIPSHVLLVGCLDNGIARAAVAGKARKYSWWVDAGNGLDFGQILVGNSNDIAFSTANNAINRIPFPSLQRPEILQQAPPAPTIANCAEIPEQGPTINQFMATLVVETVHRLITGNCHYFQLLLDLKSMTMQPVMAEPANLRKMYKGKFEIESIKNN
jgi:hypothetical protein